LFTNESVASTSGGLKPLKGICNRTYSVRLDIEDVEVNSIKAATHGKPIFVFGCKEPLTLRAISLILPCSNRTNDYSHV